MPTLERIGKDKVVNHHLEVPYRVLEEQHTYNADQSENMIIRGDNLEALKALLPRYEGRIKCIFLWEVQCMGVFDVVATIGASYILISLYCTLSHIERRYHTVWHGPKKHRRNRARKSYEKSSKTVANLTHRIRLQLDPAEKTAGNGKTNRAA